MWIYANPNPDNNNVPDCVIRAVCIALNKPWEEVSDELYSVARKHHSVTCDDNIWGRYLFELGFEPFVLPHVCPRCTTIDEFTQYYSRGIYIIGTGYHAVAVLDGNFYDTWNSGNELATFFWRIRV